MRDALLNECSAGVVSGIASRWRRHLMIFFIRSARALLECSSSVRRYSRISSFFSSLRSSENEEVWGWPSASSPVCSAACWSIVDIHFSSIPENIVALDKLKFMLDLGLHGKLDFLRIGRSLHPRECLFRLIQHIE